MNLLTETYNGLTVYWAKGLEGGGRDYYQAYLEVFNRLPVSDSLFEWCAGPAFIGFSLLAHGHCNTLCLADVNPACVEVCERTIRENGLQGQVSVYHSKSFENIPASEHWDLVVGNPPHHFGDKEDHRIESRKKQKSTGRLWSVSNDFGWETHETYYREMPKHLKEDGLSLIIENGRGSSPEIFKPMAEKSGLSVVYTAPTGQDQFYWFACMPLNGKASATLLSDSRWRGIKDG